jgi:hypothetical protein
MEVIGVEGFVAEGERSGTRDVYQWRGQAEEEHKQLVMRS